MSLPNNFTKVMRCGLLRNSNFFNLRNCIQLQKTFSIWEPDYVAEARLNPPEYDLVNVQIKGYDFSVLEKFQSYIHKTAEMMNINVYGSWAVQNQDVTVKRFKPNSTVIECNYAMKIYERNVQVGDITSYKMSLLMEAVVTACPPGVKISFHEHSPEFEEDKYIPDFETIELKKEAEEIIQNKKKK